MSGAASPTAPSPTISETSTVDLPRDEGLIAFLNTLGAGQPSAASETALAWIRHLEAGGEMPTREQTIGLLGALIYEQPLPGLTVTDTSMKVPVSLAEDMNGLRPKSSGSHGT